MLHKVIKAVGADCPNTSLLLMDNGALAGSHLNISNALNIICDMDPSLDPDLNLVTKCGKVC